MRHLIAIFMIITMVGCSTGMTEKPNSTMDQIAVMQSQLTAANNTAASLIESGVMSYAQAMEYLKAEAQIDQLLKEAREIANTGVPETGIARLQLANQLLLKLSKVLSDRQKPKVQINERNHSGKLPA